MMPLGNLLSVGSVGTNLPSIAFFKRGFGCDLVPYYAVIGYKSRWVKRAFDLRQALRG